MGYNTRRKSLSLTELGITLPKRARTQSHPSPPTLPTTSHPSPPSTIVEGDEGERPAKKSRLTIDAKDSPKDRKPAKEPAKPKRAPQLSPPPSPTTATTNKVSTEGINDDIVIGTIQQLEQTGNRPHLVKELAAILATDLHAVEKSANPSALISSRLTAYLNRPWPAISPCPLAKDLSPVHPRRLYFFLTTLPRQPIPDTLPPPTLHRIISPSASSASDEEDPHNYPFIRTRQSLSPEVDLSSPELDDATAPEPGAPFSSRTSVAEPTSRHRSASAQIDRGRRGGSPQLEREERDFKMTANALFERAQMQRRRSSLVQAQEQAAHSRTQSQASVDGDVTMTTSEDASAGEAQDVKMETDGTSDAGDAALSSIEDFRSISQHLDEEEDVRHRDQEDASALFPAVGGMEMLAVHEDDDHEQKLYISTSSTDEKLSAGGISEQGMHLDLQLPLYQQAVELDKAGVEHEQIVGGAEQEDDEDYWEPLRSPENIEVAELEDLFGDY